ncbi:Trypsin-like peptidase domain protein [uncultured archaeon]|nr:Trypsin-like peptidase domain protein [uncultured archaeon]
MRKIFSLVAALILVCSSAFADVKTPRGFDGKVYQASMALYGTLPAGAEIETDDGVIKNDHDVTHFLCTVTAFKKVAGGYELIGAGHCTAEGNPEDLPKGLVYSVSDNVGTEKTPVKLLKAEVIEPNEDGVEYQDYAVYYMKTDAKIPVIELGDESDVAVGDATVDVNFSLGEKMTKQMTRGSVASVIAPAGSAVHGMMLVQQFDSHGASGSAIVSEKTHRIIGLVIGGYDGTTTPTIAVPISHIRADVSKAEAAS